MRHLGVVALCATTDQGGQKSYTIAIRMICAVVLLGAASATPAIACEDGHWINEVLADGQILKLEDVVCGRWSPSTRSRHLSGFRFQMSLSATTKL